MWVSAHPEGPDDTDVVVVWNTSNMTEADVLRTGGRVNYVEFDGKNHLVCSTDKAVRCWRHTAMQFELLWVVEQPLGVHVSPLGGFAWHGHDVMEFDVHTAALKGSFKLIAPVADLLTTADENVEVVVIARSEKRNSRIMPGSRT
ncbi:hypothetical protein ANCCAN_30343 [Ancylostoma caninum]|uniref:Uncharacterized protein n=1 Tax=Ancylostoma caninum TaxID=29170 RepID=A0A368EXE8_ANCCA|nr:hypothetical protein ANCCAN_30343 [Ancylostoma caninum]